MEAGHEGVIAGSVEFPRASRDCVAERKRGRRVRSSGRETFISVRFWGGKRRGKERRGKVRTLVQLGMRGERHEPRVARACEKNGCDSGHLQMTREGENSLSLRWKEETLVGDVGGEGGGVRLSD